MEKQVIQLLWRKKALTKRTSLRTRGTNVLGVLSGQQEILNMGKLSNLCYPYWEKGD